MRIGDREGVALGGEPALEAGLGVGREEEFAQTLGYCAFHDRVRFGLGGLSGGHRRRGPRKPLTSLGRSEGRGQVAVVVAFDSNDLEAGHVQ
jgi:hypothetical protein